MRRVFLLLFGSLFLANFVCWWAANALLDRLAAPEICRWIFDAFIVVQVFGMAAMMGARLVGHQPGAGLGRYLLALVMIWNMLLALPTAAVMAIWLLAWWMATGTDAAPTTLGRIIGLMVVATPVVVACIATGVAAWQLNRFRVQRLTLQIPNLPLALKGFTIAHLSDLHVGKLTRGKVLDDLAEATNRLSPDLILLTGDLINFSLEDLPRGHEILRKMKSRHGLYSCEGNHDLIQNGQAFETAAKASGLSFLFDEAATFSVNGQAVQVLGVRWGEGTGPSAEMAGGALGDTLRRMALAGGPAAFTILLAHHPQVFDAAAEAGIPLTLAGHTHGGQLMLTPRFGFGPWLYRYWSGLYRQGASQLVVSNGSGNWFPLRVGAPAEIIYLTLEPA